MMRLGVKHDARISRWPRRPGRRQERICLGEAIHGRVRLGIVEQHGTRAHRSQLVHQPPQPVVGVVSVGAGEPDDRGPDLCEEPAQLPRLDRL